MFNTKEETNDFLKKLKEFNHLVLHKSNIMVKNYPEKYDNGDVNHKVYYDDINNENEIVVVGENRYNGYEYSVYVPKEFLYLSDEEVTRRILKLKECDLIQKEAEKRKHDDLVEKKKYEEYLKMKEKYESEGKK